MTALLQAPETTAPALPYADPRSVPELRGLFMIHRAMREEFARLADNVAWLDPLDRNRAVQLERRLKYALRAIHVHHTAEDDIVYPAVEAKCPEIRTVLDRLTDEHHQLDYLLDKVSAGLALLAGDGPGARIAAAGSLAAHARRLREVLNAHLDIEEEVLAPVWAAVFSAEEHAAIEKRIIKHAPIGDVAFVLPWILDAATPEERAEIEATIPGPFKVLHRLVWKRQHDRTKV